MYQADCGEQSPYQAEAGHLWVSAEGKVLIRKVGAGAADVRAFYQSYPSFASITVALGVEILSR